MSQDTFVIKRDPVRALRDALEATPEGIAGHAKVVARSPGVMYNKFSDADERYEVTVREALALSRSADTRVFAEAVAEQFGGVFVPLPPAAPTQYDLQEAFGDVQIEVGKVFAAHKLARADGVVTPQEFAEIEGLAHDAVATLLRLVAEIQATVRPLPPLQVVPQADERAA